MIVVCDTSPLSNLYAIKQLSILEALYQRVLIPQAVLRELSADPTHQATISELAQLPWIKIQAASNRFLVDALLLELDLGEAEAICLAKEVSADILLIDERKGRKVAARLGLRYTGLLGALVAAKSQGILPRIKPVVDALISESGFWIDHSLYSHVLQKAGE